MCLWNLHSGALLTTYSCRGAGAVQALLHVPGSHRDGNLVCVYLGRTLSRYRVVCVQGHMMLLVHISHNPTLHTLHRFDRGCMADMFTWLSSAQFSFRLPTIARWLLAQPVAAC